MTTNTQKIHRTRDKKGAGAQQTPSLHPAYGFVSIHAQRCYHEHNTDGIIREAPTKLSTHPPTHTNWYPHTQLISYAAAIHLAASPASPAQQQPAALYRCCFEGNEGDRARCTAHSTQ